jgi:arylsulfatase A-like enzyme
MVFINNMRIKFSHLPLFTFLFLISGTSLSNDVKQPNIVLLLADDLGFTDLGAYGSEVSTPNIDALARLGRIFNNYHSASSCAPTRAMLMSGLSSHKAGLGNMPESLSQDMQGQPEYSGFLRLGLPTIADHLKESGYRTYVAGKWHLGQTRETLPSARGFDRTFVLGDTGADNWEQKPYLPIYDKANWYADGEETSLPDDFYSSKTIIDKTIEFIDSEKEAPFFAYVAFLAVHIPVQAPKEFTDKYLSAYTEGWHKLREQRYEGAVKAGIVPEGLTIDKMSTTVDWDSLSKEEQRYEAKTMAVYAGMIEAMDFHIGRLIAHLKASGEFDNTLFVFTSDNGAEPSDIIDRTASPLVKLYFNQWLSSKNYSTEIDTLGEKGSYNMIGPSFASASVSPLSFYKFYNGEGGMRVPLIFAGPNVASGQAVNGAFSFVTDLVPTILEAAGAKPIPDAKGKSLLPILTGRNEVIRDSTEGVGFELGGNASYFQGDYKLVLNRKPVGDGQWRLYNIQSDPTERYDLSIKQAAMFEKLKTEYNQFADENGVLRMIEGYDQRAQIVKNQIRKTLIELTPFIATFLIIITLGSYSVIRIRRKRNAA